MPVKKSAKKKVSKRKPKSMHGDGFFSSLWDGVKRAANFVKDNKLVSKGLNLIPDARAKSAAKAAEAIGLGKKKRGPRKMRGKGMTAKLNPNSVLAMHTGTVGASVINA